MSLTLQTPSEHHAQVPIPILLGTLWLLLHLSVEASNIITCCISSRSSCVGFTSLDGPLWLTYPSNDCHVLRLSLPSGCLCKSEAADERLVLDGEDATLRLDIASRTPRDTRVRLRTSRSNKCVLNLVITVCTDNTSANPSVPELSCGGLMDRRWSRASAECEELEVEDDQFLEMVFKSAIGSTARCGEHVPDVDIANDMAAITESQHSTVAHGARAGFNLLE